jgi:sterol 3beta-glucosyltransferase
MNIAVCTLGSRGDVQPFLVLGEFLAKNGHRVKVSSAHMYTSLAESYDVTYVSFKGDYGALVDSEAMKRVIGRNPFHMKKKLKELVYPLIENSLETFFQLSKWADVVVYHPKTLVDSFGYLFPEKLVKASVVPVFTPTGEFASPILSFLPIPPFLNKFTYNVTNAFFYSVKTPIRNFSTCHNLKKTFRLLSTPLIYGISPAMLAKPADYPADHHYTGFWFDDRRFERVHSSVLSFLNTKRKKLIITFGSMPYRSNISINRFISALLERVDAHILVVKAWGLRGREIDQHESVMAIDSAPFSKLFPLADAVVHHGGAGTTAVALRSGVPMMITPVLYPFGDQMFWGKQVHKLGLGVKPIPLKRLKVKNFVDSVTELLDNDYSRQTLAMKKQISDEDGLQGALQIIERIARKNSFR